MAIAVAGAREVTMMSRYDQVMVPLDRSSRAEAALPVARSLATLFGAELRLVHVTWEHDARECESYLASVSTSLDFDRVVTSVVRGWPVPVITDLMRGSSDRLLCLAAHARTGPSAVLLGSVADELLGSIAAPMVVVGQHFDPTSTPMHVVGGTVLVCFDGSDLSATIAPVAVEWARVLDARIHVVMALHRDGTFLGNQDAALPKARARELTDLLAGSGVRAGLELLEGLEPARAIAAHASSVDARLLLTATHGAGGGLLRAALGSIALRTVQHAPCPVVIRRPPVSPAG